MTAANVINSNQSVTWQCPSNLAIVKYWGKHGKQLPRNPSISMTLRESKTITALSWKPKAEPKESINLQFTFEGTENEKFKAKLVQFLSFLSLEHFPFLHEYNLVIESRNTFPHSSGIASSASSMGALALCLCSMEKEVTGIEKENWNFLSRASEIARLGSGSASRSVFGFWSAWGHHTDIHQSSDLYAVDIHKHVHPVFNTFHNDILIISAGEKSVSSTAGHQLMENNPYATARYTQATQKTGTLYAALKSGNIDEFIQIAESEALTLHALMMCSEPSYTLMEPHSLEIIKRIRHFRHKTKWPVGFSLDAGPNIHFLYPAEIAHRIQDFLDNELIPLCQHQQLIRDGIGHGPSIFEKHHGH